MISQCLKTKACFGFCHQLLLKLSIVRRKTKKPMILEQIFSNFSNFGNLKIFKTSENLDFGFSLHKCF